MERSDLELINRMVFENNELRRLWEEHLEFERRLEEINRKGFLTMTEEVEQKDLKKKKLAGRDKIEQILSAYR